MMICVQGVVDYESATVYQLVVVARDRGHNPLSSEAVVIVRVEDLNDNIPLITVRTLGGQTTTAEVSLLEFLRDFDSKQLF
jgi:hypothetical protein